MAGITLCTAPSKIFAPSYNYLHNLDSELSSLNNKDAAFLGPDGGFLPLTPPACLEAPYHVWEEAASQLPTVCRSDKWDDFIACIPHLSGADNRLPDQFLPKANLCLGAIAHSIASVGFRELPDSILKPWREVAHRLRRKHISLLFYDTINNNFQFSQSGLTTSTMTDAWSQMNPCYTVTGTRAEYNFWKGTFCVEHSTRKLPSLVAAAQQAAIQSDVQEMRRCLVDIFSSVHSMSKAFLGMDSRVYSPRFVGQVEFAVSIDAAVRSIFEGQKTPAGSQSLTIHLLDAFFERGAYSSEFGKMLTREKHWIPELHQTFLSYVRKISVLQFIQRLEDSQEKVELNQLYFQALDAFAGEQGFLGIHARKLFGFVAVGTKVGRMQSSAGLSLLSWKNQNHHRIFSAMHAARRERLANCESFYFDASIVSNVKDLNQNVGNYISVEAPSKICYETGDVLSVLPDNSREAISKLLRLIGVDGPNHLTIRSSKWMRALRDRNIGFEITYDGVEDRKAKLTLQDFLRIADLKRLTENLQICGSLKLIKMNNSDELHSVYDELENLTTPLKERFYSIGSDPETSPSKIDLFVGNVRYERTCLGDEMNSTAKTKGRTEETLELQKSSIRTCRGKEGASEREIQTGVSSSFLTNCPTGGKLRIRVVPEHRFHMPKDKSVPIVMFALGRGIVPFIPILKTVSKESNRVEADFKFKPWLILGVQSPGHVLFKDTIEDAVHRRKTAKLSVACSRTDLTHCDSDKNRALSFRPGNRLRIQELFANNIGLQRQLWELVSAGAHIYCCGSPELGPVVNEILSEVAFKFGGPFLKNAFVDDYVGNRVLSSRYPNLLASETRLHHSLFNSGPERKTDNVRSMAQVACHRSATSTYVVFKGAVYDITKYLQIHPGGARLLLDFAGRDMTKAFSIVHGTDASAEAMLEAYKIAGVERFTKASSVIDKIRRNWSEKLLDQFLQHVSVLNLHLNDFPTLENQRGFDSFKTQWTSTRGKGMILDRIRKSLEPDAFNSVMEAIDASSVLALLGEDETFANALEKSGWSSLPEALESIRGSCTDVTEHRNSAADGHHADELLKQARMLMECYVDMFIAVQELVEKSCRQSMAGEEQTFFLESMMAEITQVFINHLRIGYESYPLVCHKH